MSINLEPLIDKLSELNVQYGDRYLATSHEVPEMKGRSHVLYCLDTNNPPVFGHEFFDLAANNVLMRDHTEHHEINAVIAELIGRMAWDGMRHCEILSNDAARMEFCDDLLLNAEPKASQVDTLLLWIDRCASQPLPFSFYAIMPLLGMHDREQFTDIPLLCRALLNISYEYGSRVPANLATEREQDSLRIGTALWRLITTQCRNAPYATTELLLASLHVFSMMSLGALLARVNVWPEFIPVASAVHLGYRKHFHQVHNQYYLRQRRR